MRTIKAKSDFTLFGEVYNNAQELITTIQGRKLVFGSRDFFDNYTCHNPKHYGFTTTENLIKDCLSHRVETETIKAIKTQIKPVAQGNRIKSFNSVVGYIPNVPLALMNIPTSMINQRKVALKSKVINLYVNISCCGNHSGCEIEDAGKALMDYIVGLEQTGYRVGLTAFWGTENDYGDVSLIGLRIKDSSQPFDISRCAYPFMNPSFHRGICYAWYQRTEGFEHDIWYGRPIMGRSYKNKLIQQILGSKDNGHVLCFEDILCNGKPYIEKTLTDCPQNAPIRA